MSFLKIIKLFIPSERLRNVVNQYNLKNIYGNLEQYQYNLLSNFNKNYSFKKKTVLEIGSDYNANTAMSMLKLGAKEVFAVNPLFSDSLKSKNPKLTLIKDLGENTNLPDEKFDIIWGIALLEHVNNPYSLALECKRLLKPGGICYLQGWPMWTAPDGHHVMIDGYSFNNSSNPFDDWEHLTCLDYDTCVKRLKNKDISESDSVLIADYILKNEILSRHNPSYIIESFEKVFDKIEINRTLTSKSQNHFFNIALSNYTKDDLNTQGLELYLRK